MNKVRDVVGIWTLIFLVAALICLLLAGFVFVNSAKSEGEECGLIHSWETHPLCNDGSRSLWMCTDEEISYFKITCLGVPVSVNKIEMFVPMIANASLPTPAPTMNPFPTVTYHPPVTPVP